MKESKGKPNQKPLRYRVARELAVTRMFEEMSQAQLAEKTGLQKANISRLESGRQNMSVDYVELIADAMGKEVAIELREPEVDYGDETEYSLKLYDEELMQFKLVRGLDLHAEIQWVNEDRRHLLPLELEITEEGLIDWLSKRKIPQNRAMVVEILESLGLTVDSIKGLIDISFGLSLNDSYWITRKGFEGTFAEYNLYKNPFTEALSVIAYTGRERDTSKFRTSPELTTGGMLRKAWRFSKYKGIWLYKGGTDGFANTGNEPYCEFYASQVAQRMGLNAVSYELENWKGILASKCKLFTDIDTSYIPIGRLVKTGGIEACLEYHKSLGDEFYQQLASMLVFDAVIINEDRHFGNFGLLRDNKTGKIIAPAPVFDNGTSLLCYAMKSDFEENNLDKYVKSRRNPYGKDNAYFTLARKVMGPMQKQQLRRLINFHFQESDLSNLPTWRLQAIEELLQKRVGELLKE